jgi:hypothetical protein
MDLVDRRTGMLPVLDTSEEKRIGHWRDLGKKTIRREVLEVVGWLGRDPGRAVPTDTASGVRWVDEADAANVVFLRPKAAREQRELDEILLEAEYRIGQRHRVEALLEGALAAKSTAEKEIADVRAEIETLRAGVENAKRVLRAAAVSTRELVSEVRGKGVEPAPADRARCAVARSDLVDLREQVTKAEARLSDRWRSAEPVLRAAEQRLARASASAALQEQELHRDAVAFKSVARWVLDRLALYTASTANEELRRNPRPSLRSTRELEEELDRE